MYLYSGIGGMVGISADEKIKGQVLWYTREWNNSVIAPSPVPFADGSIFVTAGYGAGSMLFNLIYSAGTFQINPIYKHSPKQGLASEQQTPILYQGMLFAILPKDAGPLRNQLVCYNPDTQKIVWASGSATKFGLGPYTIGNGLIYVMNDSGVLTLAEAAPAGYVQLAQSKLLDGPDSWGPMAIVSGRLILRDLTRMISIDIAGR